MTTEEKLAVHLERMGIDAIIAKYIAGDEGISEASAVRDLLTDIQHYCNYHNIAFDDRLQGSIQIYEEENELNVDDEQCDFCGCTPCCDDDPWPESRLYGE